MIEKKEYRVGEIFRLNRETFQCVIDSLENGSCSKCEVPRGLCTKFACYNGERSDNTCVHYVKVPEAEEGMLFRASDGNLYELKNLEARGCGCYRYGYMACSEIDEEAFGEIDLHWYPVEEKEEEKEMIDYSKIELQKIYMKRHLEIAAVSVENDIVAFKVADQFYSGDEFSQQEIKSEFKAKNGVAICLSEKLKWDKNNKILSIRRLHDIIKVEETIKCYVHHFAYIMEAVTEYNETDGKGYEKPWPQKDDEYFCIDSMGKILILTYHEDFTDEGRRDFGNFFRTREEAEEALERVKKALKGE